MQAQAPNVPLSLLGNPLTLFHPEPVSVLTQATSEQRVPWGRGLSFRSAFPTRLLRYWFFVWGLPLCVPPLSWPLSVLV